MTMTMRLRWVLKQVQADIAAAMAETEPERPEARLWDLHRAWQLEHEAWRERREDAEAGIAPIQLRAWLDRPPTHSETTLFSRAYAEGERRGWWRVLRTDGGRAWGLALVEAQQ